MTDGSSIRRRPTPLGPNKPPSDDESPRPSNKDKGKGKATDTPARSQSRAGRGDASESTYSEAATRAGLPAVKGTIGAIESPMKERYPGSPTVTTHVPDYSNGGSSPHTVFRTDPTIKTCFDTAPLPARDEIKRLFGVSS